jgi:hypothetical protein
MNDRIEGGAWGVADEGGSNGILADTWDFAMVD